MQFVKLAFVVSSCLVIRSAAAEPAQPIELAQPAQSADAHAPLDLIEPPQSVLPNVLPTSTGTILDGRLDGSRIGDLDANLLAFNLHAQYISPSGVGGYVSLPIAYAGNFDSSETALGNPEVGLLGVLRRGDIHLYVRGGLTLGDLIPRSDGDDRFVSLVANIGSRPADAIASGMSASTFRTGVGLRVTKGPLVIGGSGGLDLPLDEDAPDGFLNLSGSIGIARPGFGLAVGATLLQFVDTSEPDARLIGLQAIADGPVGGGARIYAALGATGVIGEGDLDAFSVGIGLRVGL